MKYSAVACPYEGLLSYVYDSIYKKKYAEKNTTWH